MHISSLYRRRLIPAEHTLLKDDVIVFLDDEVLITKWKTLKPKTEFTHGCSCYFLNRGIKVSKIYRGDGSLLHWYCDIVEYSYHEEEASLTVTDLLADVIISPDGRMKVVDLDELAEAAERGLITKEQLTSCLRNLNQLLTLVYQGRFDRLQARLDELGL